MYIKKMYLVFIFLFISLFNIKYNTVFSELDLDAEIKYFKSQEYKDNKSDFYSAQKEYNSLLSNNRWEERNTEAFKAKEKELIEKKQETFENAFHHDSTFKSINAVDETIYDETEYDESEERAELDEIDRLTDEANRPAEDSEKIYNENLDDASKNLGEANKDLDEAKKLQEEACAWWFNTQECKDASKELEWAFNAQESAESWVNSTKSSWFKASVWWNTRKLGSNTIKDGLVWISKNSVLPDDDDWLSLLQSIFIWVKDSLTWLLLLIAVWAFLFIWIRLGLARWNPEEFKKGIMQLVYAIVWIFVVSLAWAAVTLVSWLNL